MLRTVFSSWSAKTLGAVKSQVLRAVSVLVTLVIKAKTPVLVQTADCVLEVKEVVFFQTARASCPVRMRPTQPQGIWILTPQNCPRSVFIVTRLIYALPNKQVLPPSDSAEVYDAGISQLQLRV